MENEKIIYNHQIIKGILLRRIQIAYIFFKKAPIKRGLTQL